MPTEGGEPVLSNPSEALLHELRQQVLARTQGSPEGGARRSDSECDLYPMPESLHAAAQALERALRRLAEPLRTLVARLDEALETEADWLDTPMRERIAAAIRSIRRRALSRVDGWCAMLGSMQANEPPTGGEKPRNILITSAWTGARARTPASATWGCTPLAGPHHSVRGRAGRPRAWRAGHIRDTARRKRRGQHQ